MTRARAFAFTLVVALACTAGTACRLRPPDVAPARMIEPQVPEPVTPGSARQGGKAPDAMPIRLLDTQARGHIGRRLLYQRDGGELVEDPVWRWSSMPDRYLDSTLRLALASRPEVQLVDAGNATSMAVTLIAWHLDSAQGSHLVGAVELTITRTDRTVYAEVIRGSEPVSGEPPGDLAAAAGRLLQMLASTILTRTARANGGW